MSTRPPDDRRALIDLLPQFLTRALRGWDGLAPLLAVAGMERPAFFLLRALVQERDAGAGMTREEMERDLFNPYRTFLPILDSLPALVASAHVAREDGMYTVTDDGRALLSRVEAARDAHLGSLAPLPTEGVTRLEGALAEIARRLRGAPEPATKPHQARAWRVMPLADAVPLARLYGAVYALWMARDDAHIAAWRAAGFAAPSFDLLSRVWSGEAATVPTLADAVRDFQRPEDVARGIAALEEAGYVMGAGDALRLTPHGRETRDRIEAETDRLYFDPWPPVSQSDVAWLRAKLEEVVRSFP